MKNKKTFIFLKTLGFSFKISFQASPLIMLLRLYAVIVSAFVPILNAYSVKRIIDAVANERQDVWKWFIILAMTQILAAAFSKTTSFLSEIHNEKIQRYISLSIIDKINKLDISYFDNVDLYNETKNVSREANSIPNIAWNLMSLIKNLIQFVIAAIVIVSIGWWVLPCVVVLCIPHFVLDKYFSLKMYKWSRSTTNDTRKINYLYSTLTEKYFAKDTRTNVITNNLRDQYCKRWKAWFSQKKSISKKQFWFSIVSMIPSHFITLIVLAFLLLNTMNGQRAIGDITYYITIMSQLNNSTFGVISIISTLIKDYSKTNNYQKFLAWEEQRDHGDYILERIESIEFKSVYFTYPFSNISTLKNVSFRIGEKDKVAFIGKNGSGKTTIIKLLLKLYSPTKGSILVNGINIENIDSTSLYRLVSVMFQDYVNYSFLLKDNLRCSDYWNEHTDENLLDACRKGNALRFVSTWEKGLDSYLTKSFDVNGKELSGGQWQSIALSRAFVKKAQLFVFDEPSAALDIESEKIIYEELINEQQNNIVILVSHRMKYMKRMTKIFVLDDGAIIEKGTHEELIKSQGVYNNLYKLRNEGE